MRKTTMICLLLSTVSMVSACDPHRKDDTTEVVAPTIAAPTVWGDAPVSLRASVNYTPGAQQVGQQTTASPVAFSVPDAIYVQTGNAGNGQAQLHFGTANATTTCTYTGGSSVAHPITDLDRMHGL